MDSNLTFKVTTSGVEEAQAKFKELGATITKLSVNANGTVTATGKLTSALNTQSQTTDKVTRSTQRASDAQKNYFYYITRTTIQSALVNKAFLVLVDSIGKAAKQADLIVNFPKVMGSLGINAKDASDSFETLRKYVQSVGGDLQAATNAVTRFAAITKNVKAATVIYAGINNALIAGGASAESQAGALEQLIQAFSKSKPDAQEFRSALTAIGAQLELVAKALNLPSSAALRTALTTGQVSMQEFIVTLAKLSTGTGPIAQQALAQMSGINFAVNVLKNSLVNSLTEIYLTIGRQNIVAVFGIITKSIQVLASWVVTLINLILYLVNFVLALFGKSPISGLAKDTGVTATNLTDASLAAQGVADGLDGASKSAKKLNNQLASFDKMNVLQDKTAATGGGGATTTTTSLGKVDPALYKDLENQIGSLGITAMKSSRAVNLLGTALAGISLAALLSKLFTGKGLLTLLGEGLIGLGKLLYKGLIKAIAFFGPAIASAFSSVVGAVASALGVSIGVATGIVVVAIVAIIAAIYLIWRNWETISGWIKTAASAVASFFVERWNFTVLVFTTIFNTIKAVVQGVIDFIVAVWNTLYDIFSGPVKFILQFIEGVFIAIVAIIAIALETVYRAVVGAITLVYNILSAIATWVYENVTQPILNFFIGLWNSVVNAVSTAFRFIFDTILKPVALWIYNNVILPVFNFFRDLWNNVINFIVNFFNRAKEILGGVWLWIKVNVVDRIAQIFSNLWDGVKRGLELAFEGIKFILSGVANVFKTPLNGIIDLLNSAIRSVNKLKVPDWVPGLGGRSPGIPQLPRLAQGGVVTSQMTAIIGENGAEAVVPLENNTDWIDMLAAKINSVSGSSNQPINLVVQIGEDKVASKIIDLINEKTQMSGRNTILV